VTELDRLCTGLFVVSTIFPVAAGVYPSEAPRWLGIADVGVGGLLVTTTIALVMRTQDKVSDDDRLAAFRLSQSLISLIPVLLVLFFIARSRIKWDVLIVGLAWRAWLLLYSLPCMVAAHRRIPRT